MEYVSLFPCGGCPVCRVDNLTLWQNRIESEWIKYRSAFVTFTYDDNHLIYNSPSSLMPSVSKVQAKKFLDNIRHKVKTIFKKCSDNSIDLLYQTPNYKVFLCSEYGDKFKRPHYHALFLGLDFKSFEKVFENSWHNGLIKSLPIKNGGVRYVLDYITKTETGELADRIYTDTYREKPFILSSNGIGEDFFKSRASEINELGYILIGDRRIPVPTYWKNKIITADSYSSRLNERLKAFKQIQSAAEYFGYDDVYQYTLQRGLNLEYMLAKKMRDKGHATDYIDFSSVSTHYDLALQALKIS